jgi:hypothetical protein
VTPNKEDAMHRRHLALGIVLAVSLTATGCAGTLRLASNKTCQAHGGTYDASARACTFERSSKKAPEICQAEGGYYDPAADFCEFGRE